MNHLDVTLDVITTFTLMEEIDHPDLDNSELASEELVTKYMCMIGQLQWVFTLGRFDFLAHAMSMSWLRHAPKIGHVERMKRVYGYLLKTKQYTIRYRTELPDYSHVPVQELVNHVWKSG